MAPFLMRNIAAILFCLGCNGKIQLDESIAVQPDDRQPLASNSEPARNESHTLYDRSVGHHRRQASSPLQALTGLIIAQFPSVAFNQLGMRGLHRLAHVPPRSGSSVTLVKSVRKKRGYQTGFSGYQNNVEKWKGHNRFQAMKKHGNLYVTNLGPGDAEVDLMVAFSPYGNVVSCYANTKGENSHAFVKFSDPASAELAITEIPKKTRWKVTHARYDAGEGENAAVDKHIAAALAVPDEVFRARLAQEEQEVKEKEKQWTRKRKAYKVPDSIYTKLQRLGIPHLHTFQEEAIKAITRCDDVVVHAQTGAGKTLCYALPVLGRLDAQDSPLQALVIAPTAELTIQIARVFNSFRQNVATALLTKEQKIPKTPILVAPPSVIVSQIQKQQANTRNLKKRYEYDPFEWELDVPSPTDMVYVDDLYVDARFKNLKMLVFDEGDDLIAALNKHASFEKQMTKKPKASEKMLVAMNEAIGATLQIIVASATVGRPLRRRLVALTTRPAFTIVRAADKDFEADIGKTVERIDADGYPMEMNKFRDVGLASGIDVGVVTYDEGNFLAVLDHVLETERAKQTLLFLTPQKGINLQSEVVFLCRAGFKAVSLNQRLLKMNYTEPLETLAVRDYDPESHPVAEQENEIHERFFAQELVDRQEVLVAEMKRGARGIEMDTIDLVICAGKPPDADAFVHLAGRVGRQGKKGRVVLIMHKKEADRKLGNIGSHLNIDFNKDRHHFGDINKDWVKMWKKREEELKARNLAIIKGKRESQKIYENMVNSKRERKQAAKEEKLKEKFGDAYNKKPKKKKMEQLR